MNTTPKKSILLFAVLGGILAVSTSSIFIRFANQDAPSLAIATYRLLIANIILAPIVFFKYKPELQKLTSNELLLGLASGFFLAIHFATWISSLEYTTISSSVVLVTTTPLWVAMLSPIILREPSGKPVIIGMFLALLGGCIVGISDACVWNRGIICPPFSTFFKGNAFLGDFLALCGAWMAAGYIMIGRRLRSQLSLIPYIFIVYGMAALVLLALLIVSHQKPFGYQPISYLWLFLLALVPQLLGHSTFNWALRYLPASLVSVTLLGEPIGSTILAYIILKETPSTIKLIGAVFIIAGIYISSSSRKNVAP